MNQTPAPPVYELYALRYATHAERMASENFLFFEGEDERMPLDFYFWVLRGTDGRIVVVDTGFAPEVAVSRGRTLLQTPTQALGRLGIDPGGVGDVIVTHLHYDHAGNLNSFPRARFHLQDAEIAYCTGRAMGHAAARRPFELDAVVETVRHVHAGRMRFHAGPAEIVPGVSVHPVGGHTPGMQVVRVPTARGWVVLASDAAHYWRNIRERSPFPIVVDVPRMLEAYGTIEALADGPDHIIPGHDPDVVRRFPALAQHHDIVSLHQAPLDSG